MARLCSAATGNFTAAGTWKVLNATSWQSAMSASSTVGTTYTETTSFTPGAITVDAIMLRLAVVATTPTGTFTVRLAQGGTLVTGTEVTVNVSDLAYTTTSTDQEAGWVVLKFSAPVTLLAATAYTISTKTSNSSQVNLWRNATANNWDRALRTTTTAAPAAGDDMIIAGEYDGASNPAPLTSFTLTMDNTATTDFGGAAASYAAALIAPALEICNGGTLTWGTSASTNYYLKLSGTLVICIGGTMNIGTSGTPMPSTSTAVLEFDNTTSGFYGLDVRAGNFNAYGASKTAWTRLTADEAIGQTVLSVADTTGWQANDSIVVIGDTTSACETRTISTVDSAVQITISVSLSSAHKGAAAPRQHAVVNNTRNVKIRGMSASLGAWIAFRNKGVTVSQYVECRYIGTGSNYQGISIQTITGSVSLTGWTTYDMSTVNGAGFFANNTADNFTLDACCATGITGGGFGIAVGVNTSATVTTSNWTVTGCCVANTSSTNMGGIFLMGLRGTITNNYAGPNIGSNGYGYTMYDRTGPLGTISGNEVHGNEYPAGIQASNGTIGAFTSWDGNTAVTEGIMLEGCHDLICENWVINGGGTVAGIQFAGNGWAPSSNITFKNCTINDNSAIAQAAAIAFAAESCAVGVKFIGCSFGNTGTHSTGDVNFLTPSGAAARSIVDVAFIECTFGSSTEVANFTSANTSKSSRLRSHHHDGVEGVMKMWTPFGTIERETTTVQTGSSAIKMTPSSAADKLISHSFFVAVQDGQTVTVSAYVREDASYNGARARLIVKANPACGIASDTVLDTATASSDGAWEQLSGTTAAVDADGVLEFYVDCDGTAGNLFVDTLAAA